MHGFKGAGAGRPAPATRQQDHRRVKQRYYPMLGFKNFNNAAVTLSGIELAQKIRKGQFDTSSISHAGAGVPQVWGAVLAA